MLTFIERSSSADMESITAPQNVSGTSNNTKYVGGNSGKISSCTGNNNYEINDHIDDKYDKHIPHTGGISNGINGSTRNIANSNRANRYLLIFLHGYGCDCHDLMPLSGEFDSILLSKISNNRSSVHDKTSSKAIYNNQSINNTDYSPSKNIYLHYLSVNAPQPCETGYGYQWFSMKNEYLYQFDGVDSYNNYNNYNITNIRSAMENNFNLLSDFIDRQSERLDIPYENIFLLGFSQGAMVALFSGLRLAKTIGGIVSFSGVLPDSIETLKPDLKQHQHALLIHGTDDDVVPYKLFIYTKNLLDNFATTTTSIDLQAHSIENLAHSINAEAVDLAVKWVGMRIKKW